jgi:hypothetical protein
MSNNGCVYEKSLVLFKNNHSIAKKASGNIFVDDILICPSFLEFKENDDIYSWSSKTISNISIKEFRVSTVFEYKHSKLISFNNFPAKFSLEQPILIKRYNTFYFLTTAMVQEGDIFLQYDETTNKFNYKTIDSILIEEGDFNTHNFYMDSNKIYLVDGIIVASK